MKNQGKFIAKVTVSGKCLFPNGNIDPETTDKNGLPAVWLTVLAGEIPNRQTIAGTVAQRMGIPLTSEGIIGVGGKNGDSFGFRLIYGSWVHTGLHDDFGHQFTWTILKDMTNSSPVEIEETCQFLGDASVFTVERANLPADYQRKTSQHIGVAKLDPKFHPSTGQVGNSVLQAREEVGPLRSDSGENPEVVTEAGSVNITNKRQ